MKTLRIGEVVRQAWVGVETVRPYLPRPFGSGGYELHQVGGNGSGHALGRVHLMSDERTGAADPPKSLPTSEFWRMISRSSINCES